VEPLFVVGIHPYTRDRVQFLPSSNQLRFVEINHRHARYVTVVRGALRPSHRFKPLPVLILQSDGATFGQDAVRLSCELRMPASLLSSNVPLWRCRRRRKHLTQSLGSSMGFSVLTMKGQR